MKQPRSQLVNLLIGKSILETLFVATLAVVVWTNAFPPTFHGWGEAIRDEASAKTCMAPDCEARNAAIS